MAAGVCRHSLLSRLALIAVVVAHCLHAEDGIFREVNLHKVHQVACQHPTYNLVALKLQEAGNTSRTVATNIGMKSCVGNITYFGCFLNDTVVEVKVIVTDLPQGVTTFTCIATTNSEHDIDTKTVGSVNVTNTGEPVDSESTGNESVDTRGDKVQTHQTSPVECGGKSTAALTVVIVLTVIFGVISIVLCVVYVRARNRMTPTTAPSSEANEANVEKVKPVNQYQSSRLPPPVVRPPDAPVKGLVMQYPIPDNLSSDGP